jgi:hypothetical protein
VLERLVGNHSQLSETAISELRSIANRARRLSARDDDNQGALSELSRKCALDAFVEGLRLGEAGRRK